MEEKKRKKIPPRPWIISGVVAVVALCIIIGVITVLITGDGDKRKRHIHMVTLLKLPPPPKIEEKPPEPEVKKEEIVEPEPEEVPDSEQADDVPAGNNLGMDAEGGAGSDAFGLVGKKGGRALIGNGNGSLLRKYAWYTRILEEKINKEVKKRLDQNGGAPSGEMKALVRVVLDDRGNITTYAIYRSSGSQKMDDAMKEALEVTSLGEPPPEGMPKAMKLKISSRA